MDINAAFPGEFLKAADLQGRQAAVVIDRVEMQKVGDDHKPVAYFQGKDRGLVLNKTNAPFENLRHLFAPGGLGLAGSGVVELIGLLARHIVEILADPLAVIDLRQGEGMLDFEGATPGDRPCCLNRSKHGTGIKGI